MCSNVSVGSCAGTFVSVGSCTFIRISIPISSHVRAIGLSAKLSLSFMHSVSLWGVHYIWGSKSLSTCVVNLSLCGFRHLCHAPWCDWAPMSTDIRVYNRFNWTFGICMLSGEFVSWGLHTAHAQLLFAGTHWFVLVHTHVTMLGTSGVGMLSPQPAEQQLSIVLRLWGIAEYWHGCVLNKASPYRHTNRG